MELKFSAVAQKILRYVSTPMRPNKIIIPDYLGIFYYYELLSRCLVAEIVTRAVIGKGSFVEACTYYMHSRMLIWDYIRHETICI